MTVKDSADSFRSGVRWMRTCISKGRLHRHSQGGLCSQRRVPEGFHNAGQATGSRAQLSVNPDLPMGHAGPESQSRPRGTSTCISELPVLIQLHHQSFCTP